MGLVVPGEGREHRRILGPLLEHLRRRLDEVLLGADAADADPGVAPREQGVEQVSELVEEGADVAVLHEPRIAGLAAREVADQRRLRDLAAREAGSDVELRGVRCTCRGAGACRDRTGRRACRRRTSRSTRPTDPTPARPGRVEGDAEELAGDAEHAVLDLVVREVRPHLLRVEVVVALAHLLRVVAGLPGVHRRRRRQRPSACARAAPGSRPAPRSAEAATI